MDINDIQETYGLDSFQILSILNSNGLKVRLEELNDIQPKWVEIIEESQGLKTENATYPKHNNSQDLTKETERIKKTSQRSSKVSTSRKINSFKFDNEGQKAKGKFKTQYRKLSGPKITGNKVDLSQFSQPKKKVDQSIVSKKIIRKKIEKNNGSVLFYAYVSFIGPENDHAFVKRIEDIHQIAETNLYARDENSYKLIQDCSPFKKGEIILCSVKEEKYKLASIEANTFKGVLKNNHPQAFIDLESFQSPIIFEEINTSHSSSKFEIGRFLIEYRRSRLIIKLINEAVDQQKLNQKLNENLKTILLNPNSSYTEDILVDCYKLIKGKEKYNKELMNIFSEVQLKVEKSEDPDYIISSIKKWQGLNSDLVKLHNFGHLELLSDYFDLWLESQVNINFFGNNLIDSLIQHELEMGAEQHQSEQFLTIHKRLKTRHIKLITEHLKEYLLYDLSIPSKEIYKAMQALISESDLSNKIEACKKLKESLNPEQLYDLWKADSTIDFKKGVAIREFPNENADIQESIIEQLDDEELFELLEYIKPQKDKNINKRIVDTVASKIPELLSALSFDLESNGVEINEISWNEESIWHFFKNDEIPKAISSFQKVIDNKAKLIIGHNIIEFDYPVLEKKGLTFNYESTWDTMKVEVFLSPDLKNYALKTAHTAEEDAKLTLSLFSNQVLRILKSNTNLENLSIVTSNKIFKSLEALKNKIPLGSISIEHLNQAKKDFYRPQELENPLITKLKTEIQVSETPYKLILGPEVGRFSVKEIPGINYMLQTDKTIEFEVLNEDAISVDETLSSYTKKVLKQFLTYCSSLEQKPFWINLSPYARGLVLRELKDPYLIFENKTETPLKKGLFYSSLKDLLQNIEVIKSISALDVFVLQPDLLATTEKIFIKEIDQEFLNLIEGGNHFWMKFSGGQSYVALSNKQLNALKVQPLEHISNFWIEKYQIGKYRIWGSYNWEDIVSKLNVENIYSYKLNGFDYPKGNMNLVGTGLNKSSKHDVVRFNPESIHRSRYWVFQKQLIEQISKAAAPIILLINQYDEIEVLEEYFRKLGYYVPLNSISLGRRLELIHQRRIGGSLIITHINQIEKVLELNYFGALEIVLDNFNLGENFHAAQGSNFFNRLYGKIENTSDYNNATNKNNLDIEDELSNNETKSKPHFKDNFFLLKLQLPYVNHIRNLMFASDPNHRLWVLDSRVNDYPDLIRYWNAYGQSFKLWENEEQYQIDVEFADEHIPSVKPLKKLPFSIERIKQILSEVFIDGKEWYDSQVPYLNEIIKGEKDLLVTLPTGGGKSLLFQGPALLKGSFTNRLTVVVTPLKALMEDQVRNLWDKGFHGSVEYLNSDRGTDTKLIYRAMAGGEVALLYVTPERFRSQSFLNALKLRIQSDGGLEYFVFDEAHCVSQWGHEFRPDYFNCAKQINQLKRESLKDSPLLLFSATVSEKIYNDFNIIFS